MFIAKLLMFWNLVIIYNTLTLIIITNDDKIERYFKQYVAIFAYWDTDGYVIQKAQKTLFIRTSCKVSQQNISPTHSILRVATLVSRFWVPVETGPKGPSRRWFFIFTRDSDAYRASAARKRDAFANPSMLGFLQRRISAPCLPRDISVLQDVRRSTV